MCPIAHVPHSPKCPISICSINDDTSLPMCPIAHMLKKMSSCQEVKHMDYGGGSQKKKLT